MKKRLLFIGCFLLGVCCIQNKVYGQATSVSANLPLSGADFLGWATGSYPTVGSLDVKTMDLVNPIPIDYWTQAKARMQIYENVLSPTDPHSGNIAIGDFTTFIPQSLLHQHNNGLVLPYYDTYHQFTNIISGSNDPTSYRSFTGSQIGIQYDIPAYYAANGPVPPYSIYALKQWEQSPMVFYTTDDNTLPTNPNSPNTSIERMRIMYGLGDSHLDHDYNPPMARGVTKVTISHDGYETLGGSPISPPYTQAVSMLNLGENHVSFNNSGSMNPYIAGARSWMDIGTFYNFATDNMYTGLKNDGLNAMNAVVNWGDDPNYSPDAHDHLLFIFTQVGPATQASTEDGLEVARMTGTGHVGIGNFSLPAFGNGTGLPPARRLEVYDESLNTFDALPAAPQLRLTVSPTSAATTGVFTDFQTTVAGNLFVNPSYDVSNAPVDGNVGIQTSVPGNTLEIKSNLSAIGTEPAGLRFTNLTATGTATINPNPFLSVGTGIPAVLSVDGNGDVILVDDATGGSTVVGADNGCSMDITTGTLVQLGQAVGAGTPGQLINDREIPMNDQDIYFTDPAVPGGVKNNIGMGIATNPRTRLNVDKTTLPGLQMAVAGQFSASTTTGLPLDVAYGVRGIADNISHSISWELVGGKFSADGSTKVGTYGVHGNGIRPDLAGPVWGGYFEAVGAPGGPMPPVAFAYGVEGRAQTLVPGTAHYAVYGNLGVACPTWPPVACPTAPAFDYAGYFNGDVLSTTNIFLASDTSLKENIQDITNPMDIITQLNPKSYTFKRDQNPSMQLSDSTHFGILAQELEGILPQLVKNTIHPPVTDSVGNIIYAPVDFKAVNYIELIPFLIAGMKQQQQTIESMQEQLTNCCGAGNRNSNPEGESEVGNSSSINVELQNAKSIILNQNAPNPFAEQTTITYFLTDDVKKAQMFFYDNKGTILKTVEINEKGTGQINVFAADLSSGNYTYSLVADGKVIDTKKMLKTQ